MNVVYAKGKELCNFIAIIIPESIKSQYMFDKILNESTNSEDTLTVLENILNYLVDLLYILKSTKIQINKDLQNLISSYIWSLVTRLYRG